MFADFFPLLKTMRIKIIVFLLFACFLFAQEEQSPIDLVNLSEGYLAVAPTGSMRPTITEKDWIIYKKKDFKKIDVGPDGDIILVKLKESIKIGGLTFETYCHRAIRRSSGGSIIITKGDANECEDPTFVLAENYMGTVVAIVRREKFDKEEEK